MTFDILKTSERHAAEYCLHPTWKNESNIFLHGNLGYRFKIDPLCTPTSDRHWHTGLFILNFHRNVEKIIF